MAKMDIELKDFPLTLKGLKIFNSKNEEIGLFETVLNKLCACANYGKRFLLKKKMKSYPDTSMEDAEFLVNMEVMKEGYIACLPDQTEYQYTVKVFDSKDPRKKTITKILNFKKK